MIGRVRKEIGDITEQERFDDLEIVSEIKHAITSMPGISGMTTAQKLRLAFRPITEGGSLYDKSIYENVDNITVNYSLALTDGTSDGTIETKAWSVSNLQLAFITLKWNLSGDTGTEPTLDVSLNKDVEDGLSMPGTWLVEDDRISAINDDVEFDVSDIPSPSFSIRWNLYANANYEVLDTTAELLLVNHGKWNEQRDSIILTTAGNIFSAYAAEVAKKGQQDYAEFLEGKAERLYKKVRGQISGGMPSSLGMSQMAGNKYDRTKHADRAFESKSASEGTWVEITGSPTAAYGRRLRRTDV
jgi:hypothetical protein